MSAAEPEKRPVEETKDDADDEQPKDAKKARVEPLELDLKVDEADAADNSSSSSSFSEPDDDDDDDDDENFEEDDDE